MREGKTIMQNQTRLNHNSEETAYLVNNYPWGYTLKINSSYKLRSSAIKTRDIKKGKTMDKVINSLVKQLKQYKELI